MNQNALKSSDDKTPRFGERVQVGILLVSILLAAMMFYLDSIGIGLVRISKTSTLAFFLCMVFCAVAAYELAVFIIVTSVQFRRGAAGEVKMLSDFARVIAILGVFVAFLYSTGMLRGVGAMVGAFAGLLLGFALQAPVSGVAAWVFVTLKRPFRVGDRVLFPSLGLNGDILEVGFMYTKLDQVGGAVGSEEATSRHILVPNAMLFSQVVINYTPRQHAAYFLDEVVIRLTYDSDWDEAERILLEAAQKVTGDIIRETGREPYIRSDNYDYGVYLRLRYMTLATDRPRISHEILKIIFREFQRNPRVDFAIPFIYSYRRGVELGARSTMGSEPVVEVGVDNVVDPRADTPLSEEDQKGVEELAERIEKMGLLQPIVVRRTDDGRCELVAGRFRLLACRHLGWKVIPAIVKSARPEPVEFPPD